MDQRHMPIGYQIVAGKVQVDEEKAIVVKKIFNDYIAGVSLVAIAKNLEATGLLNSNQQTHWYHGSIAKILDNVKYLGDGFYPGLIDKELFEEVQKRRKEKCEKLGRNLQYNSKSNPSVFAGILRCGECGNVYRKHVNNSARPLKRTVWKCMKYAGRRRVYCGNCVLSERQIKIGFLIAANKLLNRKHILEMVPSEKPHRNNREFIEVDRKIKELEEEGRYSSKELPALLFERAKAFYKTAQIDDRKYQTEKMEEAFKNVKSTKKFDKELFRAVIQQITVYKEEKLIFEFINGLALEVGVPKIKEGRMER